MTVPASDAARPETTIALWLEDNTTWNTQIGTLEHIKSKLEQETRWGSIPVTLNAMHRENDSLWEMSAVYNPGVGHGGRHRSLSAPQHHHFAEGSRLSIGTSNQQVNEHKRCIVINRLSNLDTITHNLRSSAIRDDVHDCRSAGADSNT